MSDVRADVIETVKVREVFGTFVSAQDLENAIEDLLLAGFDRADIDLMASARAVREKLGHAFTPGETDSPEADHHDFVTADEEVNSTALVTGSLAYVGAIGAAAAIVASGGSLAAIAAAALAGGAGGGGLGAILSRKLGARTAKELEDRLVSGGLALWVRVRSPEREAKAADILGRHGAQHVEATDIELAKRIADVPLANIRPDPWLSDEPLGTLGSS